VLLHLLTLPSLLTSLLVIPVAPQAV